MADITDGTTNTYLVGEKYLNPDAYANGSDPGDNESCWTGENQDMARWGGRPIIRPSTPTPTRPTSLPFRTRRGARWAAGISAPHHANGVQMSFCDGSVQMISYTINPETHRRLCNRKDGQTIDGKAW